MLEVTLEEITSERMHIVAEIVHSNKAYNILENGRETRTNNELKEEFLNPETKSLFIKVDTSYIGVIDYLDNHPSDHFPWLGLLMIHKDYQGKGFAKQAYERFEKDLYQKGKSTVRLGVLKDNVKAKQFWKSIGFVHYETKPYKDGKEVDCYEKKIRN